MEEVNTRWRLGHLETSCPRPGCNAQSSQTGGQSRDLAAPAATAASFGFPFDSLRQETALIWAPVSLKESIAVLDDEIARRAKEYPAARRSTTLPGVGQIAAAAIAPQAELFKRVRDFAAWLRLTPLQRSTGGRPRSARPQNGRANIGASALVRQDCGRSVASNPWLNLSFELT